MTPENQDSKKSPSEPDSESFMLNVTDGSAKPVGWPAHGRASLEPGDLLGHFEIEACVGEGGFGVVYRARQLSPMTRTVALKLLKATADSKVIVRRFELERQALAQLTHPNIARVYEAGQTDQGRPYVAMEYVDGLPITTYCQQMDVDLEGRLHIFASVCAAVQHAHERGFIHRDLKPANILVTDDQALPVAKVIDFGVAKAIATPDAPEHTKVGQVVGTLDYMSPEQLRSEGIDIDTRTDVYALGVVLYELLTNTRPYEGDSLSSKGLLEAQRIISEQEPVRPSQILRQRSSTTRGRTQSMRGLSSRVVRGDLDWIVMRCLEKDRQRRYESALALGDEIQRVLDNKPVNAGPPGGVYRARKFVRRHRPLVLSSVAIFLALIAGIVVASIFALRERDARADAQARQQEAETQANRYQAMAEFMQDSFANVMPHVAQQYDTALLRMMLDSSSGEVEERFQETPLAEAQVRTTFGLVYQSMGRYTQAEENFRTALEIRKARLPANDPDRIQSMIALGILLNYQGRFKEAAEIFDELLTVEGSREVMTDAEFVAVLLCLSEHLQSTAEYERALNLALDARQQASESYGDFSLQTLNASLAVASRYLQISEYQDAADELELALPRLKAIGARHPSTLVASSALARAYAGLGRLDEARRLAEDSKDMTELLVGTDVIQFQDAALVLAEILIQQDELQNAIELLEMLVELSASSPGHSSLSREIRATLALAHLEKGDLATARKGALEAWELATKQYGVLSPESVQYLNIAAEALYQDSQFNEIVSIYGPIINAKPSSPAQRRLKEQAIADCCSYLSSLDDQRIASLCAQR